MKFNEASPLRFNSPEEYFNYEFDKQVKKAISGYEAQIAGLESQAKIRENQIRDLEDKLTSLGNIKDYKFKLDDPISPQVTGINHRGQLVTRGLGLTKREYFIGQALTGLLANKELGTHGIAEEAIFNGTKVAELLANED
jgi:hypothetical protein